MRPARFLLLPLVVAAAASCGQPAASNSDPPRCARTFVTAITSSVATAGVWDCLSDGYRNRVEGVGDGVFAVSTPLWTHYRYLGTDGNIAMFDLTVNAGVEPAVYDPPVSHVIMAVYLDGAGRVDRAKAATPS
jgi:hypothetical protein